MKKVALAVISLWCSINMLMTACSSPKEAKTEKNDVIQNPSPIAEPQTDSLKNYLDKERQRRRP